MENYTAETSQNKAFVHHVFESVGKCQITASGTFKFWCGCVLIRFTPGCTSSASKLSVSMPVKVVVTLP